MFPVEPTREMVLRKTRQVFPPPHDSEALRTLDEYGIREAELNRDAVQLAILRLSHRRIDRLAELVIRAKRDFGKVLLEAEQPTEMSLDLEEQLDEGSLAATDARRRDAREYFEWIYESAADAQRAFEEWTQYRELEKACDTFKVVLHWKLSSGAVTDSERRTFNELTTRLEREFFRKRLAFLSHAGREEPEGFIAIPVSGRSGVEDASEIAQMVSDASTSLGCPRGSYVTAEFRDGSTQTIELRPE